MSDAEAPAKKLTQRQARHVASAAGNAVLSAAAAARREAGFLSRAAMRATQRPALEPEQVQMNAAWSAQTEEKERGRVEKCKRTKAGEGEPGNSTVQRRAELQAILDEPRPESSRKRTGACEAAACAATLCHVTGCFRLLVTRSVGKESSSLQYVHRVLLFSSS